MPNTTEFKILDRLTAVNLNVSIWTARRKLKAEDFGGVELPPEELASLGSRKICDPETLRIFSTLKARAVNQLDRVGVRFLGGWAIPDEEAGFVLKTLQEVKSDFLEAKESFLNGYDLAVKSWIDKHPGWERLIADSPVGADHVRERLGFNWQFYKVAPPDNDLVRDGIRGEVDNLGSTLFGEIAKEAQSVWSKAYEGKTEVSHKALSPLRAMRNKLAGLSFVEPTAAPVMSLIDEALGSVPRRGLIKGRPLLTLQGLVSVLRDPGLLFEHGRKVLDGEVDPGSILFGASFGPEIHLGIRPGDLDDDSPMETETTGLDGLEGSDGESEEALDGGSDDSERDIGFESYKKTGDKNRNKPVLDSLGLW
jgi:hypothetical protein